MLFSSITFLFYFLPVFLICYFIVPKKFDYVVLLLGSLFFYAWGEPRYLLLMVMMICAGYFSGIWIQKITTPGSRKLVTALSVTFCLVVLGFFKYTDFLLENINRLPGLSVSLENYAVILDGRQLEMPPKEIELLYFLASHAGKVFTREQLLEQVWGFDFFGDSRTVDVHVKRIREKLGENHDWQLKTVWGVGYKFEQQ